MNSIINDIDLIMQKFHNKLGSDILDELKLLLNNDEPGVALEELCNMLYEYEVPITEKDYTDICNLLSKMGINASEWDMMKDLIDHKDR